MSEPVIDLKNVNLKLGSGASAVHVLKDVDLEIAGGEAIGIVGPSGSGKTTLLMVLAGLERAETGTVSVAGAQLGSLSEDDVAKSAKIKPSVFWVSARWTAAIQFVKIASNWSA